MLSLSSEIGFICPHLARLADDLAWRLAAQLAGAPSQHCALHGDFSANQVLIGGQQVAIIAREPFAQGRVLRDPRMQRFVEQHPGRTPAQTALRAMMQSYVLVLLANQQKLQVPGKAYEYMAAGGRILAVTEEKGATAELIRRVPGGAVVPPGDHEGIKRVLKAWYAEYARQCGDERNEAFSQRDIFNEYEWRELGARYAALLEECRLADTSQSDGWESYVVDDYSFAEFSPNALVLDVGSGDGSQLRELEGRGCLAVGIEPKCESVKSCRSQSLKVIRAVGEQIPLKTASCDGLICKSVLPYTEETCVLREIGRVLKPGSVGRLFYHGAGYYLRYLLCASTWKDRFYGTRALVNTWLYVATGRRLPSFLGDTIYQSRARLRRYYSECGLKLLEDRPAPTFLRVSVFIYHSIQKTTD